VDRRRAAAAACFAAGAHRVAVWAAVPGRAEPIRRPGAGLDEVRAQQPHSAVQLLLLGHLASRR
jgi:hypothetical protein